jgi:thioredoxin-related protein
MIRRFLFACILLSFSSLATLAQTDAGSPRWLGWEEGVREVQVSGKYMLVDVYTDWCGWCKKMDRAVYAHARVQELLAARFVTVKLNAESETVIANGANRYTEQECAKLLNVHSYPTTLVFDPNFQLVVRLSGYRETDEFVRFLHYIDDKQYKRYSFDQYLEQVPPKY